MSFCLQAPGEPDHLPFTQAEDKDEGDVEAQHTDDGLVLLKEPRSVTDLGQLTAYLAG